MGAFLKQFVELHGSKVGGPLADFNWNALLDLNLQKVLTVTKKSAIDDSSEKIPLPPEFISERNHAIIKETQRLIESIDLSKFPVSPIDAVRNKLEKAGIKTSEITGRQYVVDYNVKTNPVLRERDADELRKPLTVQEYQDGNIDSIFMNQSGAEGVSLHSKKGIEDQRKRHLFVWQPNGDINVQIQLMGRHNRVGQTVLPRITILSSSLPSEKRPTAILAGKLEKLNANTTANSKSALSFDSTNIFNQIGDQIVNGWLEGNPEVSRAIGVEPRESTEGEEAGKLSKKVTGRLAIMPVAIQEGFWEEVGEAYHREIDALNATGANPLDTQFHDYRAIPKGKPVTVVEETDKESYFGSSAQVNLYSVKKDYKFTKPESVQKSIFEAIGITVEGYNNGKENDTDAKNKWLQERQDKVKARVKALMDDITNDIKKAEEAEKKEEILSLVNKREKLQDQLRSFLTEIERWIPGKAVVLSLDGDEMTGVVEDVKIAGLDKEGGNPLALSQNTVKFIRNKGYKPIGIAMSKIRSDLELKKGEEPIVAYLDGRELDEIFVRGEEGDERMNKYIITGNLIKGLTATTAKGKIIDFSDAEGGRIQGILLPKKFDPAKDLRKEQKFTKAQEIVDYLYGARAKHRVVGYLDVAEGVTDEILITLKDITKDLEISVKATKEGAKWHQNKELLALTGDFTGKRGRRLFAVIPKQNMERVLNFILKKGPLYGAGLDILSKTFKDEAFEDSIPDEEFSKYKKTMANTRADRKTGRWSADEPARDPAGWVSGGLPYVYTPDNPKYKPEVFSVVLRRLLDVVGGKKRAGRPDLIRDLIKKTLGVPVTELPIHSSTTAGIFYTIKGTIRLKNINLIATLAHELGHWINTKYPEINMFFINHREEIMHLSPSLNLNKPMKTQYREGFAEFIRLYLTKRRLAEQNAPDMLESFQTLQMDHPILHDVLEEMTFMIHEWQGLTPEERIAAKTGEPNFMDKLKNSSIRGITGMLYSSQNDFITYWFNSRWPIGLLTTELQAQIEKSGGLEAPLRPSDNPYYLEQLRKGLGKQLEKAFISYSVPFKFEDRLDVGKRGISLRQALRPILDLNNNEMIRNWGFWMTANRSAELHEEGRERRLSEDEFMAMLEKFETYPDNVKQAFEEASKRIKRYQDFFVDYAVDAHYLDPQLGEILKEYMNYVPFFRVTEDAKKKGGKGAPFQRLKGGSANIIDVIENIMSNTASIIHAANANHVLIKMLEVSQRLDAEHHSQVIEEVAVPKQAVDISTRAILKSLKAANPSLNIPLSVIREMKAMQTFFVPTGRDNPAEQIITAKKFDPNTGKVKTIGLKFHNTALGDLLYKSAMAMRPEEMSKLEKIAFYGARIPRAGIVAMPDFMVRNVARDTLSTYINSEEGRKFFPILSTLKGALRIIAAKRVDTEEKRAQIRKLLGDEMLENIEQMAKAREIAEDFGGAYASQWLGQRVTNPTLEKHTVKEITGLSPKQSLQRFKALDAKGKLAKLTISPVMTAVEALETGGDVTEGASRAEAADIVLKGEMATEEERRTMPEELVIEKDVDASVLAAVAYREWAIDFGTRGAGKWARIFTNTVMFLNPRMQEVVKLFEKAGVKPAPGKLARISWSLFLSTFSKLSLFAGASVLLTLDHEDEEWYKKLTDAEKNTYIYINEKYRFPSPFAWGMIGFRLPAIISEGMRNWIRDKYDLTESHAKQLKDSIVKMTWDMVGGKPYPQIYLPWHEIAQDRHLFFDRPLEGSYLKENYLSGLRSRLDTPRFLKEYGKANPDTPLSPIYLHHILKTYFTGFYSGISLLADTWTSAVLDLPPKAELPITKWPIIKSFRHDSRDQTYDRNTIELRDRMKELIKAQKSFEKLEERSDDYGEKSAKKGMERIKQVHPLAESDINRDKVTRRDRRDIRDMESDLRAIDDKPRSEYPPNATDKEISRLKFIERREISRDIKDAKKELLDEMKEETDELVKERKNEIIKRRKNKLGVN